MHIFIGVSSKVARRTCPEELWDRAWYKMDKLRNAVSLDDLGKIPGDHLEKLQGDRAGQHSICINDQYRICFVWEAPCAIDVEIVDYH